MWDLQSGQLLRTYKGHVGRGQFRYLPQDLLYMASPDAACCFSVLCIAIKAYTEYREGEDPVKFRFLRMYVMAGADNKCAVLPDQNDACGLGVVGSQLQDLGLGKRRTAPCQTPMQPCRVLAVTGFANTLPLFFSFYSL
eukprot:3415034-Rhodomonas_salina.3